PNFFWEVGATARDFSFHGVGVPGAPGISMGRNARFAFSITSSSDDDTDVFAEILDPARPGHYLHDGRSLPFQRRHEEVVVAGRTRARVEFLRSVHGPVIFIDEAAGIAFTRSRAIDGRLSETGARALRLALAGSLNEFRRQALALGAGFNLQYADVDGNIAYV